jgi:hypothetical protein
LEEKQAKTNEELSKKSGLAFDKSHFKANTNKEVQRIRKMFPACLPERQELSVSDSKD